MYLFFDTETTGIPKNYKAPASDAGNWPRLVQVAWLLTNSDGNELSHAEYIIKPDGYVIPSVASKIHGITTDMAQKSGVDLRFAVNAMLGDIKKATMLVAHNVQFDEKIIGAELLRLGLSNIVEEKPRKCTMQASTNYCKIAGPFGYKWPRLEELYQKLFGEGFEGAHRALTDVRACARCYFELRRLGVMT